MNKVAEDLTGRSQEEAQGEQIDKIFNIIHHTPEKKEKSGR